MVGAGAGARAELTIAGRVQGVYYRASTLEQARRHGLVGWVRNEPNGDVRALVEGPREGIDELIAWCRVGPAHARVDRVDVQWGDATGEFDRFTIR